jgi:hypothetical protein
MSFKMRCPKCGGRDYGIERDRAFARSSGTVEYVFSCRCGKQLFGPALQAEYERQHAAWKSEGSSAPAPAEAPTLGDPLEEERVQLELQRKERQAFERRRREANERRVEIERARLEEERRAAEEAEAAEAARRERDVEVQRERHDAERKKAEAESKKRTTAEQRRIEAERTRLDSERQQAERRAAEKAKRDAAKQEGERRRAARKLEEAQRHEAARQAQAAQQTEAQREAAADGEGDPSICAWQGCGKPARDGSRYCSRDCSNKNARFRHKQRKDIVAA